MRRLALLCALAALTVPLATPALSGAPVTLAERWAADLASRGIALPSELPVHTVDLATGEGAVAVRPLEAFLALLERDAASAPQPPTARFGARVVGDVYHYCHDNIRECYKFHPSATSDDIRHDEAQGDYDDAKRAYDGTPARNILSFPVRGATAVWLQGKYTDGYHRCASAMGAPGSPNTGVCVENGLPGGGANVPDRAMWGTGLGTVTYTRIEWGPGLVITTGITRAHGVFTFCATESDPDCAGP